VRVIAAPFALAVFIMGITVLLPVMAFVAWRGIRENIRLRRRLRRSGRLIDLDAAVHAAGEGSALLLVEVWPLGATWMINRADLAEQPCPLPDLPAAVDVGTLEQLMSAPVEAWCENVLRAIAPKATMVRAGRRVWMGRHRPVEPSAVRAVLARQVQCFRDYGSTNH
jgi:hypothetical protein